MTRLKWWMRIVGVLYLFLFVAAAILRLPIQAEGPPGILDSATAGDPTARFVVDTWVVLGLELGVLGAALVISARTPGRAFVLVWTVLGGEMVWGIGSDIYKLFRGYDPTVPVAWMLIHSVIIVTGWFSLRAARIAPSNEGT